MPKPLTIRPPLKKKAVTKTKKVKPPNIKLLERQVEQGDESYAQQGRMLALLNEIRKELKNMSAISDKLNTKLDAIAQTLSDEAEEIKAAIEAAGAGGATDEEVTALEARLDGVNTAIEALVAAAPPPEEPAPTE